MNTYFVYLLQSQLYLDHYYVGFTQDIALRIAGHNAGNTPSTRPYKPWKLITYVVFNDEKKARAFEVYLKSGSGRTFCKKHF